MKRSVRQRKKKYTEDDLRREVRHTTVLSLIAVGGNIACAAIKWAAVVAIVALPCWAFVKVSPEIAGKNTNVTLVLGLAIDILSKEWLKWVIMGSIIGLTLLGWRCERGLRKIQTARMADRNRELERIVDPMRSSSGMERDGSAPEEAP